MNPGRRLVGACAISLMLVLAWGCTGGSSSTVLKSPAPSPAKPASPGYKWLSINLPDQYSDARSEVYDRARDCLWVMSRELGQDASETMTLTRVNVTDRSTVKVLTMHAENYDTGLIAIDSHDILWMGWGWTLMRFDPDIRSTMSWARPAYSGLARLYSGDGRMVGMTIASNGEIWIAAAMVSAVFGFNPKTGRWDRPINLTFVPVLGSVLAAPSAGIVTINGVALDAKYSPRFAVIRTTTHTVKTLALRAWQYVATGDGQIVYSDGAGNLRRLNLQNATSTMIGTTPFVWGVNANMALDNQGNIWLPASTDRFAGVTKVNPSTGAVSQFLFPIVIQYYMPRSSLNPCNFHCYPVTCNPGLVIPCIPTPESINPDVQGIAPDARGDLWMVTSEPSSSNLEDNTPTGPVVELQTSA